MKLGTLCLVLFIIATYGQEWTEHYKAFDKKEFKKLDGWAVTGAASLNYFYTCGGQMIVGGPLAFGKNAVLAKTFKLPPHYQVKINVQLWKIDSWDQERMIIYADGYIWETLWGATENGSALCGSGNAGDQQWSEEIHNIEFKFSHSQAALSVLFTSTLDEEASNESWGIREFQLQILPCPAECGVCFGSGAVQCQMYSPHAFHWFDMQDVGGWEVEGGKMEKTTCSGLEFYGGPNKMGSGTKITRIFQDLAPHYKLLIQFQFWKIDSWDDEEATLYIDRKVGWKQAFSFSEGVHICPGAGDEYPEKIVNVNYEVPHNFDAVRLELDTTLDEDMANESWGVRQFYLWVAKCADNCEQCSGPQANECTVCQIPYQMQDGSCKLVGDWQLLHNGFMTNDFSDNDGWEVSGVEGNVITDCGGTQLFGGFEKFGQGVSASRSFGEIPDHKRIKIQLELWKIDAWDGEEVWMKADGNEVFRKIFGWNDPGTYNLCGDDEGLEMKMLVEIVFGHTEANLELELSSTLSGNAQTWAFREFQVYYEPTDDCASLFTECHFQGESFDLCEEVDNFTAQKYPTKIKSIIVPKDSSVILYDQNSFNGGQVEFTESVECIENFEFSLMQLKQKE